LDHATRLVSAAAPRVTVRRRAIRLGAGSHAGRGARLPTTTGRPFGFPAAWTGQRAIVDRAAGDGRRDRARWGGGAGRRNGKVALALVGGQEQNATFSAESASYR